MKKLSQVPSGASVHIAGLPEGSIRHQFIRLGLVEGMRITCLERLPGGTLVISHNRQELALSGDLADQVLIAG